LHHSNNGSENISNFYLPLFNSVVKKTILRYKILEGYLPSFAPPKLRLWENPINIIKQVNCRTGFTAKKKNKTHNSTQKISRHRKAE
jgi:hypothetical protein